MSDKFIDCPLLTSITNKNLPSSPKLFNLQTIRAKKACELNAIWHSTLPKVDWSNIVRNKHYVCYVIEYNYCLFGVGLWSSPVAQNRLKDGEKILELRRLAICDDAPRNTASWMICKMIKDIRVRFPEINKLISYQDTSNHNGCIYRASNWRPQKLTQFREWNTTNRKRNLSQVKSNKIRWEYYLS